MQQERREKMKTRRSEVPRATLFVGGGANADHETTHAVLVHSPKTVLCIDNLRKKRNRGRGIKLTGEKREN